MKANEQTPLYGKSAPRTKPFIVLLACVAAMGGLIFGYDIAGAGGTFDMPGFKSHFGWNSLSEDTQNTQKSLINAFFGIGAMVGALTNGYIADGFGRKPALITATVTFTIGASLQGGAAEIVMMYVGRFIAGIGIGMMSMCVPVYISEAAPEHERGRLGTLWQLAVTMGIVIASACNFGLTNVDWGWRFSYAGNIIFAILMFIGLLAMPESPRWLASKERNTELRAVLATLRFEDEIEAETTQLMAEVEEEKHLGEAGWPEIFARENSMRYRVFMGMGLQMFQQLSGINSIMFYAPDILSQFLPHTAALLGTLGINIANCLATFIAVYAIDKAGRVKLLMLGGVTMMFMLFIVGFLSYPIQPKSPPIGIGVTVIVLACIYVVSFAYSWGPIAWVVCGEMFPLRARAKAASLTTAVNWIFTTVIGAIFPIVSAKNLAVCFFFFSFVMLCANSIIYLYLPETANLTILQIDTIFDKHEPRLARPGYCAPSDPLSADAVALKDASRVPSSAYDRSSRSYHISQRVTSRRMSDAEA